VISLNKKFWLAALATICLVVLIITSMGAFFWYNLSNEERLLVSNIVHSRYIFALYLGLILSLLLAINTIHKLYIIPLGRLAEETKLIHTANPSYRANIGGSKTVQNLATLINEFADRYEELNRNVREKISLAKAQVEEEKNTFVAFISELSEGVVICNPEGIILLYNRQAKEFLTDDNSETSSSTPYIGLGRSVFGLIDKNIIVHVLDDIATKLENKDENAVSYFIIVGKNNRQLRTEAVPILSANNELNGFILILYDITKQLETDNQVDILLKSLTKDLRASLGGIRAAIETIIGFPEMDREKRTMFNDIIHKESMTLSKLVEKTELEYSNYIHTQWPLAQISAPDILKSVQEKAQKNLKIQVDIINYTGNYWVNVDSYSIVLALLFILHRVYSDTKSEHFSYSLKKERRFVNIDLTWDGEPVKIERLSKWNNMVIAINDENISLSLKEVLRHHEAKVIPFAIPDSPGSSSLRLLLPAIETLTSSDKRVKKTIRPHTHPGSYDFDLFNQSRQSEKLDNISLSNIAYTVFDSETTGLDPAGGDEIISIGAVRIVNMRILHEEMMDQLVDPKRPLSAASIEIHGIQADMLEGQPLIDTVLPQFHKFAEDTVLIGHNVAFDMAFFKAKENQMGIAFLNPVLDTLILSAVVHPEQDSHAMETIADRLGVSIVGRHSAFGDALTTAEMFIKIVPLLEEKGIHTLGEAREASKKTFYSRIKY